MLIIDGQISKTAKNLLKKNKNVKLIIAKDEKQLRKQLEKHFLEK